MINWVWRFAVLTAVAVLVACSGNNDAPATLPDFSPRAVTEEPSPTPSPTPTVAPPVEPLDAHEHSAEGVEAFTLYAIDVINHAYQTNDVTHLQQIMARGCQTCANVVEQLSTIGDAGGRIEGGQLVPGSGRISVSGPADGVQTSAGVDLTITASHEYDGEDNLIDSEPDRLRQYIFDFTREGGKWKLDEVRRGADRSS